MKRKIILIVLDGVGIGELPDAINYGDSGSNTLCNVAKSYNLKIPNLQKLGIGNITQITNVPKENFPIGCFGKMNEVSKGKDSTTGHWEISGVIAEKDFPYFTQNGFPKKLTDKFLEETKCGGFLGNKAASGTEIIQEFGKEHLQTAFPIIYTSADSVFQIAAHENIIPLSRLYEICEITRTKICINEFAVGRVIARPFVGEKNSFTRTTNRKDFSLPPPKKTILDILQEEKITTIGIGKIEDLFNNRGISNSIHTKSNLEGIRETISQSQKISEGFIFTNLVDFDQLYGHRNNIIEFAKCLEEFDKEIPKIIETLNDNDFLFITADHGNDPTTPSTDHSREYVPIISYSKNGKNGIDLGIRQTFADVGKTIGNLFQIDENKLSIDGESFHKIIL